MQNYINELEKKCKRQKKMIIDKETEEVMNLAGRTIDEGTTTTMIATPKNNLVKQIQKENTQK